jgi:cellulose synthase operon protein C
MTDVTSRQLPPPRDWQAFERLVFDLFSRLWNTNDAEMHGRQGQPQAGVDVYGTDRKERARAGVQCKGKDQDFGIALTEKELRGEVEKAKSFRPKLDVFTIVTTAPNDQAIQATARTITEEHAREGLFEVRVHGWDTLRQRITDYPDLLSKHFADFAPFPLLESIKDQHEETRSVLIQEIRSAQSQLAEDTSIDETNIKITTVSSLIKRGAMRAAIDGLKELEETEKALKPRHIFRIKANLGVAYIAMGDEGLAAKSFEEAFAATPQSAAAKAYRGLAYLLKGNRKKALETAKQALSDDPSLLQAANVIFDAAPDDLPFEELKAIIPASLHDEPDVLHAFAFRRRAEGNLESAERYARKAFEKEPGDWRIQSTLAECIIQPVLDDPALALTRDLSPEGRQRLDESAELLRAAWVKIERRDDARRGAHIAANLISVLELCGHESEAAAVLEQGLRAAPDYAPLIVRAAVQALDNGAASDAVRLLENIPKERREGRDCALYAHALIAAQRNIEALEVARECERSFSGRDAELFAALALEAASETQELSSEIQRVLSEHPKSIIVKAAVANALPEDDKKRKSILRKLASAASDTKQWQNRFHAAEALLRAKMYAAAADLYDGLHGVDHDTPPLRNHLRALYFADRRREARKLFESLADELKLTDFYADIGAAIYERSGLLSDAISLLESRLRNHESLTVRLRWTALSERHGQTKEVIAWLEQVGPSQQGATNELMPLALAIDRHLADPKCLPIAYRALRQGFNDPQAHTAYSIGLFLMGRIGRADFVRPKKVDADTAVVLEEVSTGETLVRIIETEPSPEIARDEIAPTSELARQLIGHRLGDRITVETLGPSSKTFRIREIQNKYVFAHQRSLNRFSELFPDSKLIGSFELRGETPTEEFEPVFASVRNRYESMEALNQAYKEGKLPIALWAEMAGGSPLEAWETIYASPDLEIPSCFGLPDELASAEKQLSESSRLVVDPVTLWGIVRVGIADAVMASVDELALVQSSMDLIRQDLEERRAKRGTQQGSMLFDGERYHFIELTEEFIEAQIAEAERVLKFAETLPIVPAEGDAPNDERASQVFERLPAAFCDTILAVQGAQALLFSDDRLFRAVAQETSSVRGVWTQAIVHQGLARGRISPAEYHRLVKDLLKAKYVFTVIGVGNFLSELQESSWQITDGLHLLSRSLMKASNEPNSVASVLSDLLRLAWGQRPSNAQFAELVRTLGNAGLEGRTEAELRAVFEAALRRVTRTMMLNGRRMYLRPRLLASTTMRTHAGTIREIDERARTLASELQTFVFEALDDMKLS